MGGKGGVGKTTTSSSIALSLARRLKKVLILSTDPAHNLSDCFDQKFGKDPTPVQGVFPPGQERLWAMEIDPKSGINDSEHSLFFLSDETEGSRKLIAEIVSSIPGIDEAMSFSMLIQSVERLDFDVVVFDTAPTGHTLRFLNFPSILEKGMEQLMGLRAKFSTLFSSMQSLFGSEEQFSSMVDKVFGGIERMKAVAQKVNQRMTCPEETNFVAVCIPEFLSMYETERLIQQLAKMNIEIANIVINQVLFPSDDCRLCKARSKMQAKYLRQITELYEDFHIVVVPLEEEEVRGLALLDRFAQHLLTKRTLPL